MLTVLVTNTKGGCGKTTVATHLAAAFAGAGLKTALADADRQRSSLEWINRRPDWGSKIRPLDWVKQIGKAGSGTDRLIIDAPAAMKLKDAETLIKEADIIVVPVLPSIFDEGSTNRFLKRIQDLKPIRKQHATVAIVGNRIRSRSRASERLRQYVAGLGYPAVAGLRDSASYPDVALRGLSLFDLDGVRTEGLRGDWHPLLRFIESVA